MGFNFLLQITSNEKQRRGELKKIMIQQERVPNYINTHQTSRKTASFIIEVGALLDVYKNLQHEVHNALENFTFTEKSNKVHSLLHPFPIFFSIMKKNAVGYKFLNY